MEILTPSYLFLLSLSAALLLTQLPYIGKYFRVLNTLIHESGHALMAMLLNAEVLQIELFSDTSGTALTKSSGKWKKILISLSGYPVSSLTAWVLFFVAIKEWYYFGLLGILILVVINLTFFVRNIYGIFWLITYGIITGVILYYGDRTSMEISLYLSAAVILIESIRSTIQLLVISWRTPEKAGDAANLKGATYIPAIIWALVFFVITIIITWDITVRFLNINI